MKLHCLFLPPPRLPATGYEGLLSSQAVSAKKAQFKPEDRIFSASSVTGQLL